MSDISETCEFITRVKRSLKNLGFLVILDTFCWYKNSDGLGLRNISFIRTKYSKILVCRKSRRRYFSWVLVNFNPSVTPKIFYSTKSKVWNLDRILMKFESWNLPHSKMATNLLTNGCPPPPQNFFKVNRECLI